MTNHRNRFPGRRRFLKQSAALSATVSTTAVIELVIAEPDAAESAVKRDPSARVTTRLRTRRPVQ